MTEALRRLLADERVVVCVGTGGVGKTTVSAVLGLHGALSGRRTLVLTIDPARRLANSLGLDEINHTESQIPVQKLLGLERPIAGELWAMMLDMKQAFDDVVRRNTDDPAAVERILSNKYYRYFSSSLAGSQEYSAVEQLYEIARQGRYDLIVLDTPPTQHAIDFLEAPTRLYEALEGSALQWLYKPALASGKIGLGLFKRGAGYIRKILGRFTGGEMLDDLTVFLESLGPLLDGFKERAGKVRDILRDASTAFLVVTSPDPYTTQDALDFNTRLKEQGVHFAGYIVNRVHEPVVGDDEVHPDPNQLTEMLMAVPGGELIGRRGLAHISRQVLRNAEEFGRLAERDREMLALVENAANVPMFTIPFYARDIYTLRGLDKLRRDLFQEGEAVPPIDGPRAETSH